MKNQALSYSKDRSKKLKCRLLQFLFGALMFTIPVTTSTINFQYLKVKWNGWMTCYFMFFLTVFQSYIRMMFG